MTTERPNEVLGLIAFVFVLAILSFATLALWTVVPRKFRIPGNQPSNWHKENWRWQDKGFNLKSARVEQAACLEEQIVANREHLDSAGRLMRISFVGTITTAIGAAILLMIELF